MGEKNEHHDKRDETEQAHEIEVGLNAIMMHDEPSDEGAKSEAGKQRDGKGADILPLVFLRSDITDICECKRDDQGSRGALDNSHDHHPTGGMSEKVTQRDEPV